MKMMLIFKYERLEKYNFDCSRWWSLGGVPVSTVSSCALCPKWKQAAESARVWIAAAYYRIWCRQINKSCRWYHGKPPGIYICNTLLDTLSSFVILKKFLHSWNEIHFWHQLTIVFCSSWMDTLSTSLLLKMFLHCQNI